MIAVRQRLKAFALAAVASVLGTSAGLAQNGVEVLYRAADTVYIDAGHEDGLVVGQRFITDGAEFTVIHLARKTAACKVLDESLPVRVGETARRSLGGPADLPGASGLVVPAAWPAAGVSGDPLQPNVAGIAAQSGIVPWARLDGSISFDWEVFDGDGRSADFERRVTRLNLWARGLGSEAHELRLRMSGQSYGSTSRDRVYEAAFTRRSEESPVSFSLGRLAGGSRIGYGALDGSLLEYMPLPGLAMGGFYGSLSDLDSLEFDEANRRYGVFFDYFDPSPESPRMIDFRMSGIREELLGETSRDYFSFESRLGASDGAWSFQQTAELDLNSGWRYEMSGHHLQLSSLSLRLGRRFDEGRRLSISYDRFQLYRTGSTRWLASEFFDDRPRHALRANFSLGEVRGWRVSLGASMRSRESDPDRSYSFTARARSAQMTPWHLTLSSDLLLFSNPMSDGYTTRLRVARPFDNRRRIYFDVGRREWSSRYYESAASAHWLRVGGDLDVGRNISIRTEYELSSGDALAGRRFLLGVRYRLRSHR